MWVEQFRPFQLTAVAEAMEHYAAGKRVVWLDAPTGSGKTLIAEMVRRSLGLYYPALYVATTKTLQDQFAGDYHYAAIIKGRSNYPTLDRPHLFPHLTAAECTKEKVEYPGCPTCLEHDWDGEEPDDLDVITHCHHCHPIWRCPYEQAKREALGTRTVTVANTAFLLTEANGPGRFSAWDAARQITDSKPFGMVVVDEADSLEAELMGFIEWRLSKRTAKELDLKLPPPERKTKPEAWTEWIAQVALPALQARVGTLYADLKDDPTDPTRIRRLRAAERLLSGLEEVGEAIGEQWVYTGYDIGEVAFKPISVRDLAPTRLWRHAQRWLAMSATIISPAQMSYDTGLEPEQCGQVFITEGFPANRRPVIVKGVADMRHSTKGEEWPKMAAGVGEIVARYPGERILVHTVSYDLGAYLTAEVGHRGRGLTYRTGFERQRAVEEFKRRRDAVLFAPSLDRGIDLPDDLCRVVVVAKIPYPNLADKQVSARLHAAGGQGWYSMMAVRSLVQMTGRAMRHEADYADNWILDRQFVTSIWDRNRNLLPKWWTAALQWYPDRLGDHRARWAGLST